MDERDELARRAKRPGGARRKKGSSRPDDIVTEIRPKRRAPLSKILLVGGATRMPSIPRFLENMTGTQLVATSLDPDQVSPNQTDMLPALICQFISCWGWDGARAADAGDR